MRVDIEIKNEHTFNNCGSFDIVYQGEIYPTKWSWNGDKKEMISDAPEDVYKIVYNYLFDENI